MIRHAILFCIALVCFNLHAQTTQPLNLVTNESFETVGDNDLPKDWRTITTWGTKGKFASDNQEHHSGQRSVRIISEEGSQNYVASDVIPVSPGDTFFCSGWVKAKD